MTFYAGFDIEDFPGLDQLKWLKEKTNLSWCGYHLTPPPGRPDSEWKGKREALTKQGWGLLPLYRSQQADPAKIDEKQGKDDGSDAAELMDNEKFRKGAYVFIDWRSSSLADEKAKAYLLAWADNVMKGKYQYRPGVCCSGKLAAKIATWTADLDPPPELRIWATKETIEELHPYSGSIGQFETDNPANCGYADAIAYQYEKDSVLMLWTLQVGLSSSTLKDPSAP
ncbi:DUF1906 domain-containing protein [Burkholderia humptydooensis]|uniref:DUF1906 domain-containing protein n=2 Tax=Burkholderia humptydooensis TaxID=430531 RepID=A0A7U4P6R1_9BURK|nr:MULTISPECIES: glycoside hydrolase domain-containing protein [Burkholderia]AJY41977.1 hypothetical protein BW21_3622 [Burkholderia sp. 2002721687]ALX44014.1 hypothetical protein AQ610_17395 [Burkholderia humptydooensis]EIP89610.1 hypothetical protein A33K_13191 [Burkholderia humptydooensis MSMB43]QPS44045.1 DUF1906 domain-containing protein [Burkholderia humptydooensis]